MSILLILLSPGPGCHKNCLWTKHQRNRHPGGIRSVHLKAVARWQHPQAGRPRGGSPAPLVSPVIRAGPDRQVQSVESGTEDSVSSVHVKRSVCKRTEQYPIESAVFTENRTVFIQLNQRKLAVSQARERNTRERGACGVLNGQKWADRGFEPICFVSSHGSFQCTTLCRVLYA